MKIEKLFDIAQQKGENGYNSEEPWKAQKEAVKEWLKQKKLCKIPCKNCFLSMQCPYPRIVEDLEK